MEEQHGVFLEKTEPAEPGPSQTAVVWSVMVFLWCEVWSSGGSARACCDDFHSPSRNMFPETGHFRSFTVQSWLTMACVCGGVCITGLELHLCCPDFLLSFFPPWTSIPWQQAMTQHLLPFVFYPVSCSCLFLFYVFLPPVCVPHTIAQTPFRQCVHVKAFIVLETPYFLPLSSSANVFPHLILIFTVPIKPVFGSSLPPDSGPFAHICPQLLAQGATFEPLSMRELFLETGPYKWLIVKNLCSVSLGNEAGVVGRSLLHVFPLPCSSVLQMCPSSLACISHTGANSCTFASVCSHTACVSLSGLAGSMVIGMIKFWRPNCLAGCSHFTGTLTASHKALIWSTCF